MKRVLLVFIILFSILAAPAFADTAIANSKDWKDVYSVVLYSNLAGIDSKFLVSDKHSLIILNEVSKQGKVEAYSSSKDPYVVGYKSILETKGFDAEEYVSDSFNIYLGKKLEDIDNYIIVDQSYSYNAISVAPYAVLAKSYVLFADRDNIAEVSNFLSSRDVKKVLVYGYVDREVRQALQKYSLEIINKDNDKFENNLEIVKRFKAMKDVKQVTLTNGAFIEASLMSDFEPNLFIGRNNVPDLVKEYIKKSDIEVGVLVGNDLIDSATMIRRQTGISTFVKFARSARQSEGTVSNIEGLDIFRLPPISMNLTIESIKYNALAKQIYVTIRNRGSVAAYVKGTYSIKFGEKSITSGDVEPVFIEAGNKKTLVYNVEPIDMTDEITVDIFALFGESRNSLEYKIEGKVLLGNIDINDDSAIEIDKAEYSKGEKRLYVSIRNAGPGDVYVDTEAADVMVIDTKKTLGSTKTVMVPAGATKYSIIKADLSDEDLSSNENVKIKAYYGKTEDALVKIAEKDILLGIKAFDLVILLALLIIILLIIIMVIVIIKKKKKA